MELDTDFSTLLLTRKKLIDKSRSEMEAAWEILRSSDYDDSSKAVALGLFSPNFLYKTQKMTRENLVFLKMSIYAPKKCVTVVKLIAVTKPLPGN